MVQFGASVLPWLSPVCFLFLMVFLVLQLLRSFWIGRSEEVTHKGICLEEKAEVVFPSGSVREGSIWQHTHGARCIYAAIVVDGCEYYYSLDLHWRVASEDGRPVYQGM